MVIAGPWLYVLGGVLTDAFIVQPLTDLILLSGAALDSSRTVAVVRLFRSLSASLDQLAAFYRGVVPHNIRPPAPERLYPHIRAYPSRSGSVTFRYTSRLTDAHSSRAVYKARTDDGADIVVKFVQRYNADAHQLLAARLMAPDLLYYSMQGPTPTKYGGLAMVVMKFVEGRSYSLPEKDEIKISLKEAVDILHENNLVFGDLRPSNILVVGERVKLIDFDWCAEDGEGRYPVGLNPEGGWHPDVGGSVEMRMSHDDYLLNKLLM